MKGLFIAFMVLFVAPVMAWAQEEEPAEEQAAPPEGAFIIHADGRPVPLYGADKQLITVVPAGADYGYFVEAGQVLVIVNAPPALEYSDEATIHVRSQGTLPAKIYNAGGQFQGESVLGADEAQILQPGQGVQILNVD